MQRTPTSTNADEVVSILNQFLGKIMDWMKANELGFSPKYCLWAMHQFS